MKVHITNLYNFNAGDELVAKQHRFADAGRELGFTEMGIFSYPVESDTARELYTRMDGILAALEADDIVIMQLPTKNGYTYESLLFNKIKAYRNTKIILILHDLEMISNTADKDLQNNYITLYKGADTIVAPSATAAETFKQFELNNLLFYDNITMAEQIVSTDIAELLNESELPDSTGYISLCQSSFYIKKILMDSVEFVFKNCVHFLYSKLSTEENTIQIAFGLHDKAGNYSMWVGVTMQSIIKHTNAKICFHILHDDTLLSSNKEKLMQLIENTRHHIQFHEINSTIFTKLINQVGHFTIGTLFRILLPELLPTVSKIIYLDADLLINRDILDLWKIDIENYALAAVPDMGVKNRVFLPYPVYKKSVSADTYFNAGVLYINLSYIRAHSDMKNEVLQYLIENPDASCPDQDALNVLYNKTTLLLPDSWNYFVTHARTNNETHLQPFIYHFAGTYLKLDSLSEIDFKYFETITLTPWGKTEGINKLKAFVRRQNQRISLLEQVITKSSNIEKRIFYGKETYAMKNLYSLLCLKPSDYRISEESSEESNDILLPCKSFSHLMQEKKGTYILFVLPEADNWTAINKLSELGFQNEIDYFIIPTLLSAEKGGYL